MTDASKIDLAQVMDAMVLAVETDSRGYGFDNFDKNSPGPFTILLNMTFATVEELTTTVEQIAERVNVKVAQSFRKFPNATKDGIYRGFFYCRGRRNQCPFKVRFSWKSKLQRYEIVEVKDTHIHKPGYTPSDRRSRRKNLPRQSNSWSFSKAQLLPAHYSQSMDASKSTDGDIKKRYIRMKSLCDEIIIKCMDSEAYYQQLYPQLTQLLVKCQEPPPVLQALTDHSPINLPDIEANGELKDATEDFGLPPHKRLRI